MRYRLAAAMIMVAGGAFFWLFASPSRADTPPVGPPVVPASSTPATAIGQLGPASPLLPYSGSVENPTPLPLVNDPVPFVCGPQCREFTFQDADPRAPFLVSLANTVTGPGGTFNANDGFDLYLYGPSGRLIGAGNGIGANGQAVEVAQPSAGTYTIVVTFTYAEDPNAAYRGEVRLMDGPTWKAPPPTCGISVGGQQGCFDLPILRALPAYDLAVSGLPPVASTPLGFPFPVDTPTASSCYADESVGLDNPSAATLEHPAQRCLRFTSDVQNVGAGPLEVRLPWLAPSAAGPVPQSGLVPGQCQADQVIPIAGGATVTRPAGPCEFHPAHAHFHYKNLISFTLYQRAAGGGLGTKVGSALKESFCLADDDYFGFGTTGPNGPRLFVGQPGCNVPSGDSHGAYVFEGISSGWGDVYTWDTPDQYIDITGLPAGNYSLVEETNPSGSLLVSGPAQTCALTQLQLTSTAVTLQGTEASITCPG